MTMQSEAEHDTGTTGAGTLLSFHPGRGGNPPGGTPANFVQHGNGHRTRTGESHTLRIFDSPQSRFSLVHSAIAGAFTLLTGNAENGLSEVLVFSDDTNIRVDDIRAFQKDNEASPPALRLEPVDGMPTWIGLKSLYESSRLDNGYHTIVPKKGQDGRGLHVLVTPYRVRLE